MFIRTILLLAASIFVVCPAASATCWKLKDGSFVSGSKSPQSGAKKTLARYCAPSKPAVAPQPPSSATPPPAATTMPLKAWVGSPVSGGVWASVDSTQLPNQHHRPYGGDWSVDIDAEAGDLVAVYAAPEFKSHKLTASVSRVDNACRAADEGGQKVEITFQLDNVSIGRAIYSHLAPSVAVGDQVDVWGGKIGEVYGGGTKGTCWTGSHVHIELASKQEKSCWSKEWRQGSRVGLHDFIGFVGATGMGARTSNCP